MPEKKAPSKRSNGSAKPETSKTKASAPQKAAQSKLSNTAAETVYVLSDEEIARKAYALWEYRGRPLGSPEEDWYKAKQELRAAQGKSDS